MAFYGYTGASRAGHCGGGVGQRHGPDTPQWVPFPMPPVLRSQQGIGADKCECAGAAREGGRGDVIAFELDTDRGTFHAWKEGVLCFSHIRALEGELHFCIVNARMTEYFAEVLRYYYYFRSSTSSVCGAVRCGEQCEAPRGWSSCGAFWCGDKGTKSASASVAAWGGRSTARVENDCIYHLTIRPPPRQACG